MAALYEQNIDAASKWVQSEGSFYADLIRVKKEFPCWT